MNRKVLTITLIFCFWNINGSELKTTYLPTEIWRHIFRFVDNESKVINVAFSCKMFYNLFKSKDEIKKILKKHTKKYITVLINLDFCCVIDNHSKYLFELHVLEQSPLFWYVNPLTLVEIPIIDISGRPLQTIPLKQCDMPNIVLPPYYCATLLKFVAKHRRSIALKCFLSQMPRKYFNTPFISGQLSPLLVNTNSFVFGRGIDILKTYQFDFNQYMSIQDQYSELEYTNILPLIYYLNTSIINNDRYQLPALHAIKLGLKLVLEAGANPSMTFKLHHYGFAVNSYMYVDSICLDDELREGIQGTLMKYMVKDNNKQCKHKKHNCLIT